MVQLIIPHTGERHKRRAHAAETIPFRYGSRETRGCDTKMQNKKINMTEINGIQLYFAGIYSKYKILEKLGLTFVGMRDIITGDLFRRQNDFSIFSLFGTRRLGRRKASPPVFGGCAATNGAAAVESGGNVRFGALMIREGTGIKMKKMLALALAATLAVSMTACKAVGEKPEEPVQTSVSETSVYSQQEESGSAEKTGETQAPLPPETTESTAAPATEPPVPALAVGETQTVADVCEFSVDDTSISARVEPPQPGGYYTYYEADRGKVYVDICVAYKNLSNRSIGADDTMSATLLYAETYRYTGFSIIEKDSRSNFTYSNITDIAPLSTEYIHYLFEVPAEVETSGASVEARLSIGGQSYQLIVREGGGAPASGSDPANPGKTSGAVARGERISTPNAEASIDFSAIAARIEPPQPDDYYSYYDADAGKVYVDICFAYKNLASDEVDADEIISATLTYAGQYEYAGFTIIEEDNRGDFTYANITGIAPLATEYVHYLFEVPAEVETSGEAIEISFFIDGSSFTYTVR